MCGSPYLESASVCGLTRDERFAPAWIAVCIIGSSVCPRLHVRNFPVTDRMHAYGRIRNPHMSGVCAVLTKSRQEFETCQLSARWCLGTQEPRQAVHCAWSIDSENILSVMKPGKKSYYKNFKCSVFPMGALHPSTSRLWVHRHPWHPVSRRLCLLISP